jgi:amino acid permease
MQYYIALTVIFVIWMYWKIYQHSHEVRFERDINAKLDKLIASNKALSDNAKQNSEDISRLTKSIEKLVEEIRNDREARHGK